MNITLIVWIVIGAVALWISQFVDLMQRRDNEFPGRYDKPIWAAVMIFGSLLGSIVYWFCKPRPAPQSNESLKREYQ